MLRQDISPTNLDASNKHAASKGWAQYQHVLHPRTAGFVSCVQAFGDRLDAVRSYLAPAHLLQRGDSCHLLQVYDLTITYDNHPVVAASSDPRPSERHLLTVRT